jgi:hypothetical protein
VKLAVIACASLALVACRDPATPRHAAHGAVLAVAQATRIAAELCEAKATSIYESGDKPAAYALIEKCEHGYAVAVPAIRAAAYAVDAWGAAETNGKAACAVSGAMIGLREIVEAVTVAGVKLPREVDDGIQAASWLIQVAGVAECVLPEKKQ